MAARKNTRWAATAVVVLATLAGPGRGAPGEDAAADPWRELGGLRFNEARRAFGGATTMESRERAFGEAVALLNRSPRSEASVAQAAALLETVAWRSPRDELGFAARYQLARVQQVHRSTPDLAAAARLYRGILADAPKGHLLGEMAAVKLILLTLHAPGSTGPSLERWRQAEKYVAGLILPAARRDAHLALGRAALDWRLDIRLAREHLQRAWDAGVHGPPNRADLLMQLATLSEELGDAVGARAAIDQFLTENPRDPRVIELRRRRAALSTP